VPLFKTNKPIWTASESNPGLHSEKLVTASFTALNVAHYHKITEKTTTIIRNHVIICSELPQHALEVMALSYAPLHFSKLFE